MIYRLTPQSRAILLCSQLSRLAGPFIGLFLNLYLWRQTNDLPTLIFYNAASFLALPVGFIVNGLALNRLGIKRLFQFSFLVQIITPLIIVFFRQEILGFLPIFGAINGFGSAFYWANINYLTFKLNEDKDRGYFVGLDFSIGSIIGIVAPILAGLIVSSAGGYYTAFAIAAVIFFLGFLVAGKFVNIQPDLAFRWKESFVQDHSWRWLGARAVIFFQGLIGGATLYTGSVLALNFFSGEASIGYFNGIMGVVGAVAAFIAAHYITIDRRFTGAIIGTIVLVAGALWFSLTPTLLGFVAFIASCQFGGFFTWTAGYSLIMREIERGHLDEENKYHYVVDNEIFINLGRLLGLAIFFLLLTSFPTAEAFRVIILLTAPVWLADLLVLRRLTHD